VLRSEGGCTTGQGRWLDAAGEEIPSEEDAQFVAQSRLVRALAEMDLWDRSLLRRPSASGTRSQNGAQRCEARLWHVPARQPLVGSPPRRGRSDS
jgi:hypothetical protein